MGMARRINKRIIKNRMNKAAENRNGGNETPGNGAAGIEACADRRKRNCILLALSCILFYINGGHV
jgi:hypothetical protein